VGAITRLLNVSAPKWSTKGGENGATRILKPAQFDEFLSVSLAQRSVDGRPVAASAVDRAAIVQGKSANVRTVTLKPPSVTVKSFCALL